MFAALEVRVERRLTPQTPVTANKPVIGSPAVGDPEFQRNLRWNLHCGQSPVDRHQVLAEVDRP